MNLKPCRSALRLACASFLVACAAFAGPPQQETFNLQAYIFCPIDTWCDFASEQDLRDAYMRQVEEMNREWIPTGFSFRPLDPIIIQEDRFSAMTGPTSETSPSGENNADMREELLETYARPFPEQQTIFLLPSLEKCWNGVPCPGTGNDGLDGDDVVYCYPPGKGMGRVYAHEMGHNFCLVHTFSGKDSSDGSAVEHDGDLGGCGLFDNVEDTPADPGVFEKDVPDKDKGEDEDEDGNVLEYHEWCKATSHPADPGSPHSTYCSVECYQQIDGVAEVTDFSPMTENAMSYYKASKCRAPFVVGGEAFEAFTDDQVALIQECRDGVAVRADLVNACPLPDGDSDRDGWCNSEDLCPNDFNTMFRDSDGDGVPNECDLCPNKADPENKDNDQDGLGDVCDDDDDNDTCLDDADQNPYDGAMVVGSEIYPNCNPQSGPHYISEGLNTDHDDLKNCEDPDDDNDGTPDEEDPCPTMAFSRLCVFPGPSCPLNPIWFTCKLGDCNELFLRIQSVINPDPTTDVILDEFQVIGSRLSVGADKGRTLSQTARAFQGLLPGEGGGLPAGKLEIQIVEKLGAAAGSATAIGSHALEQASATALSSARGAADTYRVLASLGAYEPREVRIEGPINGTRLEVVPATADAPLSISWSWAPGATPGTVPEDRDRDGVPDFADHCQEVADPAQTDTDEDGYGDACDFDFDQDGRVGDPDLARVRSCRGVDLTVELVDVEDDPSFLPAVPNDPAGAQRQLACELTDANGDGVVDGTDVELVALALGRTPGPSAFVGAQGR